MITEKQLSWKTEEFIPTLEDYPSTDYFCIHPLIKACKISFELKTRNDDAPYITDDYNDTYYSMEYSFDKITWYSYTKGTILNINSAVYFRGIDSDTSTVRKATFKTCPYRLTASKLCYVSGQLSTLLVGVPNTTVRVYDMKALFLKCSGLASAKYLTFDNCITKVPDPWYNQEPSYPYSRMFKDCINLQHSPALPTTDLYTGQYYWMFYNCKALLDAPDLLAETSLRNYCYYGMFDGCESLVTAPKIAVKDWNYIDPQSADPHTASHCLDEMFSNCKRLTTPAAINPLLASPGNSMRYMYKNCANLNKLPDISNFHDGQAVPGLGEGLIGIFADCPKIRMSTTQHGTYVNEYPIDVKNAVGMFYGTGGEYTNTWENYPFGTYYTSNEIVQYE